MGAGRGFYVGRNRMGLREAPIDGRRAASQRLQYDCSTGDGIDWCAADWASWDARSRSVIPREEGRANCSRLRCVAQKPVVRPTPFARQVAASHSPLPRKGFLWMGAVLPPRTVSPQRLSCDTSPPGVTAWLGYSNAPNELFTVTRCRPVVDSIPSREPRSPPARPHMAGRGAFSGCVRLARTRRQSGTLVANERTRPAVAGRRAETTMRAFTAARNAD